MRHVLIGSLSYVVINSVFWFMFSSSISSLDVVMSFPMIMYFKPSCLPCLFVVYQSMWCCSRSLTQVKFRIHVRFVLDFFQVRWPQYFLNNNKKKHFFFMQNQNAMHIPAQITAIWIRIKKLCDLRIGRKLSLVYACHVCTLLLLSAAYRWFRTITLSRPLSIQRTGTMASESIMNASSVWGEACAFSGD